MNATQVDRGPSPVGSVISVVAAVGAVGLVAGGPAQLSALAVEIGGLVAIAAGLAVRRRGYRLTGIAIGLLGVVAVGGALVLGIVRPAGFTERLELLPGMVGVAILAWGLLPATAAGSRRRIALGTGGVLAGVLGSGVMYGAEAPALLGATAMAVVAWDAGEQAISLGEQVGRAAETAPVVFVHSGAAAAVGLTGILLARGVWSLDVTGLPLGGLVLLLGAAVALAVALYARG